MYEKLTQEITKNVSQIEENKKLAEAEAREAGELSKVHAYLNQSCAEEGQTKAALEKSIEEKKRNLSELDYVLEEEKRKVDEILAATREKDEQVVSGKEMEAVDKKARTEKTENAVEEELEAKRKENEKLEAVCKQLKNCGIWCQEKEDSIAQIIDVSKTLEKTTSDAEEMKKKTLAKIIEQKGNSTEYNSKLKAEVLALSQEIETRTKNLNEAKAKYKNTLKELNEKMTAEGLKEKQLKESKEKASTAISKCNENIKDVETAFEKEQAAIEGKMKELIGLFEGSFKTVLDSAKA